MMLQKISQKDFSIQVIIRPSLCGFIISMHWFMGRSSRGLIGLVTIINLLLNN